MSEPSSLLGKVIDGAIAGGVGVSVNFPLDSLKTRIQESKNPRGFVETFRNVYDQNGTKTRSILYQGYTTNLYGIVFEKAIKLCVNDFMRDKLKNKNQTVSIASGALAGATAGFVQSVVTTPMELFKIKGQIAAKKGEKFSLLPEITRKFKIEGISGFYRGWCATVIRDMPWSIIYFPSYAVLKDTMFLGEGKSFWGNFIAGMVAGAASSGICTPMDVIKTRLQKPQGLVEGEVSKKIGYVECASSIYKNEGMSAFFKGWQPRMVCVGVLMAVAQGFYELRLGDKGINRIKRVGWG